MERKLLKIKANPRSGYLYLISAVGTGRYKIGRTSVGVAERLRELQTSSPVRLRYVYHAYVSNVDLYEMELHQKYAQYREIGEWFNLTHEAIKECIFLMRLVQETEPDFPEVIVKVETETLEALPEAITWSGRRVKEAFCESPDQLFLSVSDALRKGTSVRDVIRTVLKCREANSHPSRSYSRHGKTLLLWLIENYDDGAIANMPEVRRFLS